ncbi:hypothetical protein [Altibacter sp. HG106]|uniref:hypothetical protein n=1 Tax=Altibacter sp. HG106 TaxID=3023937 RepID=UPI00234FFB89|nr:hypothetical protein [Altibacter sp. HG106]MDC7995832.1 hypothetical protein [Altibacter sp. HG106]
MLWKKIMLLFAVAYCCNLNSQCELNDPELFTGDFMVTQVTPGIFGPYLDTFDPDGGGVILTLYSEVTDSSQDSPDVSIASNQRSFDAVYLPEAGNRARLTVFSTCLLARMPRNVSY